MKSKDQIEVDKLWVQRCLLVKQRIHANTFKPTERKAEREILWANIQRIDTDMRLLGVDIRNMKS